jgi:hypothetical protein
MDNNKVGGIRERVCKWLLHLLIIAHLARLKPSEHRRDRERKCTALRKIIHTHFGWKVSEGLLRRVCARIKAEPFIKNTRYASSFIII